MWAFTNTILSFYNDLIYPPLMELTICLHCLKVVNKASQDKERPFNLI
jgi:hypothetical protein